MENRIKEEMMGEKKAYVAQHRNQQGSNKNEMKSL
jgi:hypothetical protein